MEEGEAFGRVELLVAADRYDLSGLKKLCENSLVEGLTIDNVLDLLVLADTHNAEDLKKAAKNLVVEKVKSKGKIVYFKVLKIIFSITF